MDRAARTLASAIVAADRSRLVPVGSVKVTTYRPPRRQTPRTDVRTTGAATRCSHPAGWAGGATGANRSHCHRNDVLNEWARQDSNLRPRDYERQSRLPHGLGW